MKVILSVLLVFSLFTLSCANKTDKPPKTDTTELTLDNQEQTVYINPASTVYHSEGCQNLTESKIIISKKEALVRNFEPCKTCMQ